MEPSRLRDGVIRDSGARGAGVPATCGTPAQSRIIFADGAIPAQLRSGGTFFFTVTLADRRSSTLVDHIASLRAAFRVTRNERPFTIDAVVILPEHLHAIITLPPDDFDYSGRWRQIKSHFTRQVVARGVAVERNHKGEYALWQRRFWEHTIRDEKDFARHFDYVHFNPIKHGLVSRVSDWPHSSFQQYVRNGLLPEDWAGVAYDAKTDFGEPAG
jgi:putative transposase